MMVRIHRCSGAMILGPPPFCPVQGALGGVECEVVKYPALPPGRRTDHIAARRPRQLG